MEHFIAHHTYLALFLATIVSSLGIPIGSEIAIGYAGAIASGALTTGDLKTVHLHLGVVIGVAVLGELVGSCLGYGVGRFGGRPLVDRLGKFVLLTNRDLDRAEAWIARRGEPFVFFGRLIPLVRSFVSVAAGLAEMTIGRFLVFTIAGSAIFTAALAGAGDLLGPSWHHVVKDFSYAGYVAAGLVILVIAAALVHRIQAVRAERNGRPASGPRHAAGRRPVAQAEPATRVSTVRPVTGGAPATRDDVTEMVRPIPASRAVPPGGPRPPGAPDSARAPRPPARPAAPPERPAAPPERPAAPPTTTEPRSSAEPRANVGPVSPVAPRDDITRMVRPVARPEAPCPGQDPDRP